MLVDTSKSLIRARAAEPHNAGLAPAHGVLAAAQHTPTLLLRLSERMHVSLPPLRFLGARPPRLAPVSGVSGELSEGELAGD